VKRSSGSRGEEEEEEEEKYDLFITHLMALLVAHTI
jgi:hypothetical protein